MRKQEMHNTRGRSKRRAEDMEKEEGGQEREIEVVTDSEMQQPMGDKEETEVVTNTEKGRVEQDARGDQPDKAEARREPDWQEMMRLMMEKIDSIKAVSYTHLVIQLITINRITGV